MLYIYTKPNTIGVAEKTGFCSIISCEGVGEKRNTSWGTVHVQPSESTSHTLLVRPEDFTCTVDGPYTMQQSLYLGGRYQYKIIHEEHTLTIFGDTPIAKGTRVSLTQKRPLWVIPQ